MYRERSAFAHAPRHHRKDNMAWDHSSNSYLSSVVSDVCDFFYSHITSGTHARVSECFSIYELRTNQPYIRGYPCVTPVYSIGSNFFYMPPAFPSAWTGAYHSSLPLILTLLTHRRIVALTGEPNPFAALHRVAHQWLRVPRWSAEDPSNLLQVMLAKGCLTSPFLPFQVHRDTNSRNA